MSLKLIGKDDVIEELTSGPLPGGFATLKSLPSAIEIITTFWLSAMGSFAPT